ncbi:MAG: DUF1553 domain-containing protein [Fibrella sp.]|nr:DUF1553 domain-containing protein [Armatimonadota bacterium]
MPKTKHVLYPLVFAALPLLLAFAVYGAPTKPSVQRLRYNRDIRPILAENCFSCHGPDSAARQAGLRLDRFSDATVRRGGRAAIVPGDPIGSGVVERITKPDSDGLRMPPITGHKRLTEAQTGTIIRWIADGAQYETHWSYQPPRRTALPPIKNTKWVKNPIDRFVLARLESTGLQPAPEADRRTLVRRVSLDLTGLPPEPAEVERFIGDRSSDAYEKMVDRYLASPRWGEHRGRYWLDAARYADTHGIHFDNYREMWSYRDWVINAFNSNMPFDTFGIEQLAGDLLPKPTLDQQIATGFNRCNITTNEGGSIDEEVNVMYTRDRTETTTAVFMATTAGCAGCHDHKFDPLTQKEFYALSAYFNNSTQKAMDGNIKDTPPIIPVPRMGDRTRATELEREIAGLREQAKLRKETARPSFEKWLGAADAATFAGTVPTKGLRFALPLKEGTGSSVSAVRDGVSASVAASAEPGWESGQVSEKAFVRKGGSTVALANDGDFENNQAFTCAVWVKVMPNTGGAVIARMDDQNNYRGWDIWVENNRVGTHIISKWPEDAVKVVTREPVVDGKWHQISITYTGGMKKEAIRVYVDGVAKETDAQADALKSTIRTTVPLKIGQRSSTSGIEGMAIQDVRLYDRALGDDEVRSLASGTRTAYLVSRGTAGLAAPEKDELFAGWLTAQDAEYKELLAKMAAQEAEQGTIRQRGTVAHVAHERDGEPMAYVLFRGEYDKRRDPVKAVTPAFLPAMPKSYPKNRLGFAKWLFLPEHPLTARVTVNRFWQEMFGTGLVRTSEDFGIAGEQPSHPELLDHLAVEFRTSGWDVKKFFKTICMSATYRQAATSTPMKKRLDPQNRLLSRGPRFRMDAEMVRDYALASSGLLVDKRGGPSVKPYQPGGVWEAVAMPGSDTREYKQDGGENLYRRSLYTFWKRSAPPASLDIFNAPSREGCTVRRERTNTPLQALVTMNDTQFVEAARFLAQRALTEGGPNDTKRLDFVARRLLARPLKPQERMVLEIGLDDLQTYYQANPTDGRALLAVGEAKASDKIAPEKLAAWTMVVNQMMNMDEVLNQ